MAVAAFKIAGNKTNLDWMALLPKLNVGDPDAWHEAANEFYFQRLLTRYLVPLDRLQTGSLDRGEGFSIMAIQCSLIEFLESTYEGKNYVYRDPTPPYEYSRSGEIFVSFLTERAPFASAFDCAAAESFYRGVRCGILHEAATTNEWHIRRGSAAGAVVDIPERIVFHQAFRAGLNTFMAHCRAEFASNINRQRALIRKFTRLAQG